MTNSLKQSLSYVSNLDAFPSWVIIQLGTDVVLECLGKFLRLSKDAKCALEQGY